ncbi:Chemotaxis protein CheY [Fundidesulfovibrio magnetotacticus]|uniref:Chemotaxis protein CheY n=1 Tax=Fundidesulfovibrio magnetotacticus TaxID=2730080 RepID=A0A6V8LQR1_9BACT|nr:response regulator [Fundidesulfovibrio magnetotacticus]GFK94064.1 Chemotaxis protein CheY [Fundidesulfovibrio magnetotacticus]
MRVLIVDDDFYSRSFLEYILHPYALCDVAENGEEAIMAFQQALKQAKPYDLVCMDLRMPEIDGATAMREIRDVEKDRGVPREQQAKIIITSVLEDAEDTHNAMFLGDATAFLQKPIEEKALLAEMKRLGLIAEH